MMNIGRRDLLTGAAALVAAGFGGAALAADHLKRVGIQIYTLRNLYDADPLGTLTGIRRLGYDEVELGEIPFDLTKAKQLRRHVDRIGLGLYASHFDEKHIFDRPEAVMAAAQSVNLKYVVLAYLAGERRRTLDDWRAVARRCNTIGALAKARGLKFAYHNHDFEFAQVDGQVPFDVFLAETDADLVKLELDLYWATKGGVDIPAFIKKHAGRIELCHIKDMAKGGAMANVGEGVIDFKTILVLREQAGLQHFLVERDDLPAPYWPGAKTSLQNLRSLAI